MTIVYRIEVKIVKSQKIFHKKQKDKKIHSVQMNHLLVIVSIYLLVIIFNSCYPIEDPRYCTIIIRIVLTYLLIIMIFLTAIFMFNRYLMILTNFKM
mmetsp:Transcript_11309/g.1015  ORF Transcript_11309/g.1015 Transcript_11309/m.1015 type:complete len:97 (+) Transcript_11309:211-501(+)